MGRIILIEASDIAEYRPIGSGVNEATEIQSYIAEAQDLDIMPALGNPLFTDLCANRTEENYKLLLEGCEYEYEQKTYSFVGLKAAICYFAHSRYQLNRNVQDTPFGAMVKGDNEYGRAVSDKEIQRVAIQSKTTGQSYLDAAILYLKRNSEDFELFESSDCDEKRVRPKAGFRMTKIG